MKTSNEFDKALKKVLKRATDKGQKTQLSTPSKKRSIDEVNEMVNLLWTFIAEATDAREGKIAFSQILILTEAESPSFFADNGIDIYNAVIAAEKWLTGEADDEALFV